MILADTWTSHVQTEVGGSAKALFWYYFLEMELVRCIYESKNSLGSIEVKRNRLVMALHVYLQRATLGKPDEATESLS